MTKKKLKQTAVKDLATQKTVLKYLSGKIFIINSLTKRCSHQPYKKSDYRLYTTVVTKKKTLQQNAVHDQQSVSH